MTNKSIYKIGVFGSAEGKDIEKVLPKAKQLGEILGKWNNEIIIITGACPGLPNEVALNANKNGSEIWGYSESIDLKTQQTIFPQLDFSIYRKLFYVPKKYGFVSNSQVSKKYRNVSSTANCDAGIIISGRWGTLNEFTNLYDMGKVIGVFTGTGGIADELEDLNKKIHKPGKAKVIFNTSPEKLLNQILTELDKKPKLQ